MYLFDYKGNTVAMMSACSKMLNCLHFATWIFRSSTILTCVINHKTSDGPVKITFMSMYVGLKQVIN